MNRNLFTILGVMALVLGAGLAVTWLASRERAQTSAERGAEAERRERAPIPDGPAPLADDERAPAVEPAPEAEPAPIAAAEVALLGRVLAAEDGAPLAKARVVARLPDGATLIETETDEQGSYRLDFAGAAPAAVDLAASFPGRESRALRDLSLAGAAAVPDLMLNQGFTVVGRVLALGSRRPIEDAVVELACARPGFELGSLDTATDEDGAFEFAVVTELPRDALQVTVVADGFETEQRALPPVDDSANALTAEILLADAVVISGEVYDGAKQKPIAGALVEVDSSRPEWVEETVDTVSDDEGRFRIELREFPARNACVFARSAGLQATCLRLAQLQITDHVQVGRLLLFPPVVLRGVAVDAGSQEHPRAGLVRVRPKDLPEEVAERFQDSSPLRKDGTFELALENAPTGCPLELLVAAEGYLPGRKDLMLQPQPHSGPVAGLKIELARAVRLHGTVVGAAAAPLDGARVQWWLPADEGRLRLAGETVTNAQGEFELDVPGSAVREIGVSVEFHGRRAVWPAHALAVTDGDRKTRPVLALPGATAPAPESGH